MLLAREGDSCKIAADGAADRPRTQGDRAAIADATKIPGTESVCTCAQRGVQNDRLRRVTQPLAEVTDVLVEQGSAAPRRPHVSE